MLSSLIRNCYKQRSAVIGNAAQSTKSSPSIFGLSGLISSQFFRRPNLTQICSKATLNTVSKKPLLPPVYRRHKKFDAMKGNPQRKGIIVKLLIKKPKKPNSANRKCAYVRLADGSHVYAYIPGIGHSLQEHNVVLIQGGGPQDVPYVYCSVIRGKLDCPLPAHKIKKKKK
ncbi:small ribosomal subunit protein uS12m-like [Symsagittifera roscoffensis]|uniref:small ribosomal subunit protein uS12m-like n=1 Tax=Symsagittifera roscoffensis TaxID=84072 RepID=UPI00307CC66E